MRKERAQTDIQLQQERDKNVVLTDNVDRLQQDLASLRLEMEKSSTQHTKELNDLKKLLAESMRREAELRELNQEAYSLLTLYGINSIPSTTTNATSMKPFARIDSKSSKY